MAKQGHGRIGFFCPPQRRCALFWAAALLFAAGPAAVAAEPAAAGAKTAGQERQAAQSALTAAQDALQLSAERSAALKAELQALGTDQKRLSRALAAAAQAEQASLSRITAGIAHLRRLTQQEEEQRAALDKRQAETAEILAGLEKLSLNPPPVLFVRAEDRRQSLQAALLLAALLPQMRARAAAVRARLNALSRLAAELNEAQENLRRDREDQAGEHMRLSLLLEEKKQLHKQKQKSWREEEEKRRILAAKAQNLQDLLAEISKSLPGGGASVAGAMQVEVPFAGLRGLLPRPVAGRRLAGFGQTAAGRRLHGEIMETAPAAIVLAPAEGVVRYAGRFRSYGQLVIIDAGDNYYIVLAGMAQIHVAPEQFLLQGEPVGNMENLLLADKGGLMIHKAAPQLYVEIRKDGKPLDPALWWAAAGPVAAGPGR